MKRTGSATVQTHSPGSSQPASAEDWQAGGFGIYIHWPFCAAKCPYCDFNSHVSARIDHGEWRRAYMREIGRTAHAVADRTVTSVFFGGGTPSLMEPATVDLVLDTIARHWRLSDDLEVTLEANPTSVEAGKFRQFRAAGVNRLSLGIQALNDGDLKALGRLHNASEAMAAFGIARTTFDRVSFDLIYARQNQKLDDWEQELARAAAMAVDHVSLYQLTIEPGTRFGELAARNKLRGLPSSDLSADMYVRTAEILQRLGLPAYEISNHAKPGAECRHNLVYWRYGDYAGIGPGAHGRLTIDGQRYATCAAAAPGTWLATVGNSTTPEIERDLLSPETQSEEMLMMGLRLSEGIDPLRFERLAGRPLSTEAVNGLEDLGLLCRRKDRLALTEQGRPLADAAIKALLA
jgi:putative oxygen-independent coproporphyrinogen III oxidase